MRDKNTPPSHDFLKNRNVILFIILALALILRLGHWLAVHNQPFFAQLVMDSFEYDRWAQEIAGGEWVGSEVFFQAPLYPYFLAVIYTIFGRHLDVVYLLQILLAVAGCYALYRAGSKIAGESMGLAAAALAAAYGVFLFYDVQVSKETLAVTIVCFLLWVIVEAREKAKVKLWLLAGLLCGALSLLRENMLIVVFFLLFIVYRKDQKLSFFLTRGGILLLGVFLVLSPVAIRNGVVGGVFLPTTFQGGVNFYIGNNPDANGTYQPIVPGKQIPSYEREEPIRIAEQETGRKLTAMEVSNHWFRKSFSWAKNNPLLYMRLQFKKFLMFWSWYEWPDAVDYYYVKSTSPVLRWPLMEFGGIFILAILGVWLVRRQLRSFTPVWVFLVAWMVSTVIFFLFSRYRLPSVPCLILFAAVPVTSFFEAWRAKNWRKSGVLALVFVIALGIPRIFSFSPRGDLIHYNLGLIHENQGQIPKAIHHYREAVSVNPNDFLSCVNLGNINARQNDWSEALEWYKKALSIEPESDGVHVNLGNSYIVLENLDRAEFHLNQALKINPKNIEALHNKSILMATKGNFEEALKLNNALLKIAPEWSPALRFRKKLENRIQR